MKTYSTPKLVAEGRVIELTMGAFIATNDPDMVTSYMPFGSIGFNV